MYRPKKTKTLLIIILGLFSISLSGQRISAYQSGSYYPGLLSLRDLAAVPEGFYLIDYNYWVSTGKYFDKDGNQFEGGPISDEVPEVSIEPSMKMYINVPVFYFAKKINLLGATYLGSIAPLYMSFDQDVFLSIGNESGNIQSTNSGFGDLSLMPLGLSWSKDKIDFAFLYTVYTPTGRFEIGASDNLGQGFWTHQLQFPAYYYLNERATAFAVTPTLEMNSQLEDSDFKAGNQFNLEIGISQYLTSWLELELMSGHSWQITDDTGEDIWWKNTRFDGRDSKNTISAGVGFWVFQNRLNLRTKYIHDYGVKQGFQNRIFSFSLIWVTGIMSGN